jgi:hypothetical protein
MSSKDHWRITTAAIQLEMERIAGLLQKSVHFQSRTTASHAARHEAKPSTPARQDALKHVGAGR